MAGKKVDLTKEQEKDEIKLKYITFKKNLKKMINGEMTTKSTIAERANASRAMFTKSDGF